MHCFILAKSEALFPPSLLPVKGRACIDYLIDDALLQKDITAITLITNPKHLSLVRKHVTNAFPSREIGVVETQNMSPLISPNDDAMILQGAIHTSLKLQDFIRYFKQFKTVTKAVYDKQYPKEIPFYIIPKKYWSQIDNLPKDIETHTYNCGTGYVNIII